MNRPHLLSKVAGAASRKLLLATGLGGLLLVAAVMVAFFALSQKSADSDRSAGLLENFYDGCVDGVTNDSITGWVWDKNHPNSSVAVDIYDGETLLGTAEANFRREDLATAGIGDGTHGFSFPTPSGLKDGKRHFVRAKVAGTTFDLRRRAQGKPTATSH